jgi:ubiquinone/menaquinone biosynthesis C-methylase UbiE
VNKVTSMGQVVLWRKEVVWAASLHPDDRVLDAFCGPGGLAAEAIAHLGSGGRLTLGDLSPVMLHEATKRLGPILARRGENRPRVDYVAGDLLRQDLGLRGFDVVLLGGGCGMRKTSTRPRPGCAFSGLGAAEVEFTVRRV